MDLEFESRDSGVRSNYAPGGHSAASEDVLILRTGRMLLNILQDIGHPPTTLFLVIEIVLGMRWVLKTAH